MRNVFLTICFIAILFYSCNDDESINPNGLIESSVDISGTWNIINVLQNDTDITNLIDFSPLNLVLTYNDGNPSTFEITGSNGVPFALKSTSGIIVFNDLAYPTELFFTANENIKFSIVEPIVSNSGFMKLSVSLGCSDNIYTYSFKKI